MAFDELKYQISADDRRFTQSLKKAANAFDDFTWRNKRSLNAMNMGMKSAAGGIAALGTAYAGAATGYVVAVKKMTGEVAKHSEEVLLNADALGVSTESYQELTYAMGAFGGDASDVRKTMMRMSDNALKAASGNEKLAGAFKQLGLDAKELKSAAPDEIFRQVTRAIAGLDDPLKRAALAQDLLGRNTSRKLMPALSKGVSAFDELREEAHKTGQVLSGEALQGGQDYADAMYRMDQAVDGLVKQLGVGLVPTATQATEKLTEFVEGIMSSDEHMDTLFKGIVKVGQVLVGGGKAFAWFGAQGLRVMGALSFHWSEGNAAANKLTDTVDALADSFAELSGEALASTSATKESLEAMRIQADETLSFAEKTAKLRELDLQYATQNAEELVKMGDEEERRNADLHDRLDVLKEQQSRLKDIAREAGVSYDTLSSAALDTSQLPENIRKNFETLRANALATNSAIADVNSELSLSESKLAEINEAQLLVNESAKDPGVKDESDKRSDALEREDNTLQRLADRYLDMAKGPADRLREAVEDINQLQEAGLISAGQYEDVLSALKDRYDEATIASNRLVQDAERMGESLSGPFQESLRELVESFQDGAISLDEFATGLERIEESSDAFERLKTDAEALTLELRTQAEVRADTVSRYQEMLSEGLISESQYAKAVSVLDKTHKKQMTQIDEYAGAWQRMGQELESNVVGGLSDALFGALTNNFASTEDALKSLVAQMLVAMAKAAALKAISSSIGVGDGGGGGVFGSIFGALPGFSGGGRVFGAGTSTSDSIPARLSRDEYVVNAAAARAIGYDYLDSLNSVKRGGRTGGGRYAGGGRPSEGLPGSAVKIINITDPSDITATMAGAAGEKVIFNVISRNPRKFRAALNG